METKKCAMCDMDVDCCVCMLCSGMSGMGMSEKERREAEVMFADDPFGLDQYMDMDRIQRQQENAFSRMYGGCGGKRVMCESDDEHEYDSKKCVNVTEPEGKPKCMHGNELIERGGKMYVVTLVIEKGEGKSSWCDCHVPAIKDNDQDGKVTLARGSPRQFAPTDVVMTATSLPKVRENCGCKEVTIEGVDYHVSSITDWQGVETRNLCKWPCQLKIAIDSYGHVRKMGQNGLSWSVNDGVRTVIPTAMKVRVQVPRVLTAKYGSSHEWSSDLFLRGMMGSDDKMDLSVRKSFCWCDHVPTEFKIRYTELNGVDFVSVDACTLMSMTREPGCKHFDVDQYEGMWVGRQDLESGCYMHVMARQMDEDVELMVNERAGRRGHPRDLRKWLEGIQNQSTRGYQMCENKSEMVDGVMMFTNRYKLRIRCIHTTGQRYYPSPILA